MVWKLVLYAHDAESGVKQPAQTFVLKAGKAFKAGRVDCDILIEDGSVSRHHATFLALDGPSSADRGMLTLRDMSRYGTYLNKNRITAQKETLLEEGDVIQIGDGETRMEILWEEGAGGSAGSVPAQPAVVVPRKISAGPGPAPAGPAAAAGPSAPAARPLRPKDNNNNGDAPPPPQQPGAAAAAAAGSAAAGGAAAGCAAATAPSDAATAEVARLRAEHQSLYRQFLELEKTAREATKEKTELQAKLALHELNAVARPIPPADAPALFHGILESAAMFLESTNTKPAAGLVEALAAQLETLHRQDELVKLTLVLETLLALKARGSPGFDDALVAGNAVELLLTLLAAPRLPVEVLNLAATVLWIACSSIKALQRARAWPGLEALKSRYADPGEVSPETQTKIKEIFDKVETGPRDEVSDFLERELAQIVGLAQVKEQVRRMLKAIRLNERRKLAGIEVSGQKSHNLVLLGNPGTGKTTVARLLAKLFFKIGLTAKDVFIEASREDLVAGYVGQTAIMTKAVIDRAQGGVLFIDEAYRLSSGGKKDFGKEAIETLMTEMTRQDTAEGGVVFLFAGYEAEMTEFKAVNPGLARRISYTFTFEDYSVNELVHIVKQKVLSRNFKLGSGVGTALTEIVASNFTVEERAKYNGGLSARLVDAAVEHLNMRLDVDSGSIDTLVTLTVADFAEGAVRLKASWWE